MLQFLLKERGVEREVSAASSKQHANCGLHIWDCKAITVQAGGTQNISKEQKIRLHTLPCALTALNDTAGCSAALKPQTSRKPERNQTAQPSLSVPPSPYNGHRHKNSSDISIAENQSHCNLLLDTSKFTNLSLKGWKMNSKTCSHLL